jgi:hypothetical protein
MSGNQDDDARSNAIDELEAAAMLVSASAPDDAEATAAYEAALKEARAVGLTPEEITAIVNKSVDILGDLIVTLSQVGTMHIEGMGTIVPTEKARAATTAEWERQTYEALKGGPSSS